YINPFALTNQFGILATRSLPSGFEFSIELEKLPEGTCNYPEIGARLLPGHSRQMVNLDLAYSSPTPYHSRHQLGRYEGSLGVQIDPFQNVAPEELEAAIDIGDAKAEQYSHQHRPGLAVEASHQGVRAMRAPADHDVVVGDSCREQLHVGGIKLAVTV